MFTVNKKESRLFGIATSFLFFIVLYLFPSQTVQSQNIEKYYRTYKQEVGTLYYIVPQKGFENTKQKSELIYDLTYFSGNDSLVFNFSYKSKSICLIDSISFLQTSNKLNVKTEKIFLEPRKYGWECRYTAKCPFYEFSRIFDKEHKPELILLTKETPISLLVKSDKFWKKQVYVITQILKMIEINDNE